MYTKIIIGLKTSLFASLQDGYRQPKMKNRYPAEECKWEKITDYNL